MTLQPIVENALTHAFVKTSGYGCLTIEAVQMDDDIVLKVIDDGCGMAPNLIDGLLNKPYRSAEQRGFGLRNVHERLKMYYGEGYGLEITSTINSGTSVVVRIPFCQVENAEYKLVNDRRCQNDKSVDC
jgi:two-component system sensor histidine kinase YesM